MIIIKTQYLLDKEAGSKGRGARSSITGNELSKILEAFGFQLTENKGSHSTYIHPENTGARVTFPKGAVDNVHKNAIRDLVNALNLLAGTQIINTLEAEQLKNKKVFKTILDRMEQAKNNQQPQEQQEVVRDWRYYQMPSWEREKYDQQNQSA